MPQERRNSDYREAGRRSRSSSPAPRRRRSAARSASFAVLYAVAVIGVSALLACVGWIAASDVLALNKEEHSVTVTITPEDSYDDVVDMLKDNGLIEYKSLFKLFSAITGGRYDRVLLSRDFSLSAEPAGDPVGRSVRLLSQGAADQLYLAVRLAICDMVLPADKRVPLILDDALVTFDDERLHAALDYLLEESQRRQILLFTCQKREMAYLRGKENVTVTKL